MLFLETNAFILNEVIEMWQKAGSLVEIQFLPEPRFEIYLKRHSSLLVV